MFMVSYCDFERYAVNGKSPSWKCTSGSWDRFTRDPDQAIQIVVYLSSWWAVMQTYDDSASRHGLKLHHARFDSENKIQGESNTHETMRAPNTVPFDFPDHFRHKILLSIISKWKASWCFSFCVSSRSLLRALRRSRRRSFRPLLLDNAPVKTPR